MELFRIKRDIPFMKHALIFNAISFITFALAVFFLATRGLHFSIEFTGGTVVEVEYAQPADINKTRHVVEAMGFGEVQVQKFGTSRDVMIRLPLRGDIKQTEMVGRVFAELCKAESGTITPREVITEKGEAISKQLCLTAAQAEPIKLSRSEVVGPAVGAELAQDAAKALAFTVVGIMIYLAFRFEWKFAVAGIIANLHDVVIILGFFAFFQWEFSLAVLAAVLAVLGYSVNESVVIFDRVREAFRKYRKLSTSEVIDHAITSTMSRTFITHGSTATDGVVDADLRRPDAALLRGGTHHRHRLRHLLVGVRCCGHRDVAGRQARGPGEAADQQGRSGRSQRRGAGVESI